MKNDGRPYSEPGIAQELEEYHERAVSAHRDHANVGIPLPRLRVVQGELIAASEGEAAYRVSADDTAVVKAKESPEA